MNGILIGLLIALSFLNLVLLAIIAYVLWLERKAKELRSKIKNPSTELEEFIADLSTHGTSFLKVIDPSIVFFRGGR